MADYFGKGCTFFSGMWEETIEQNEDYKNEYKPILVYCSNYRNSLNEEGNCCKELCPKLIKNKPVGSNHNESQKSN